MTDMNEMERLAEKTIDPLRTRFLAGDGLEDIHKDLSNQIALFLALREATTGEKIAEGAFEMLIDLILVMAKQSADKVGDLARN